MNFSRQKTLSQEWVGKESGKEAKSALLTKAQKLSAMAE
jgi:hypothetical protein